MSRNLNRIAIRGLEKAQRWQDKRYDRYVAELPSVEKDAEIDTAPTLSEISESTDKMGFPLPLGDWLRGPGRGYVTGILHDRRTRERGMVDPAGVERALARPGRYDRGLYSALLLELWCRTFLDE